MERQRKTRRTARNARLLHTAATAHKAVDGVLVNRGQVFLAAAVGGWSMRELASETGLSASTVCRIINDAEVRRDVAAYIEKESK